MSDTASPAPGTRAAGMTPPTTGKPVLDVPYKGLITVSVMLGTVMQVLDTTIANVALPTMQADLGATAETINWVLTSYIVAAAIVTAMTGWVADRIGRRQLFLISIAGFVMTSVACGLSTSLTEMVIFRLMQGVFGASLVPLSQTFLLDINPPEKHGQAMALWGAGIMVGPIIGPTLGGWLTEVFDWRWVFFINLPVGILAFIGSAISLPRQPLKQRYFDLFGFAMLAIGIGALQMMLDRGSQLDWFGSVEIQIELGLTIIGFWIAIVHLVTAERPFLEPRMFTDVNFVAALLMIFVVGMVLLASIALLPPMLDRIYGYPVLTTGLVMAPRGMGTMLSMVVVGRLVRVVDPRLLIAAGLGVTAWSLFAMAGFSPIMGMGPVIWTGVAQGIGMGLVFVPLSTTAFSTMTPSLRGDATALYSLVRNIGSSIGISVASFLLASNIQVNRTAIVASLVPNTQQTEMAHALLQHIPGAAGLQVLDGLVTEQALMIGYLDDYRLMAWLTLAAIPLAFVFRNPHPHLTRRARRRPLA